MTAPPPRRPRAPLPRAPEELGDPKLRSDVARALRDARVVWADYPALQRDFPQLRDEKPRQIDSWLLRYGALVSERQLGQEVVNTPIRAAGPPIPVVRPVRYGRAFVVPVDGAGAHGPKGAGMLDLKGVGVAPAAVPSNKWHRSGLLHLEEALSDLMMQRLVEAVFRHAAPGLGAVPIYAVLDAGFDYRSWDRTAKPAGIQVRGAHRRPETANDLPRWGSVEQEVSLAIELTLRRYGLTSCNHGSRFHLMEGARGEILLYARIVDTEYWTIERQVAAWHEFVGPDGPREADGINVQLTREVSARPLSARLVDFGQYRCRPRFGLPLVSLVRDRVLRWGGMIPVHDPRFVQPDPGLLVPLDDWGPVEEGRDPDEMEDADPQSRLRGARIAAGFRSGRIDRREIDRLIDEPVARAERRWAKLRPG